MHVDPIHRGSVKRRRSDHYMKKRKPTKGGGDFHGSGAPAKSPIALILVDVINDFKFPEAKELLRNALGMAKALAELCSKARKRKVPVIYVNDNFGRWQSDFKSVVSYCLMCRGREFVKQLLPKKTDYFVLKPKHSGFYSTTLETLLDHLGAKRLVITGVATNICVFFTANDAYMRDFKVTVPSDCVAANKASVTKNALHEMEKLLKADIRGWGTIKL